MPIPPQAKQTIKIPVGGGLQEKVAANLLDAPNASEATNVIFTKDGQAQRRYGTEELGASDDFDPRYALSGSTTALAAVDASGIWSWNPLSSSWLNQDSNDFVSYTPDPAYPLGYQKITIQNDTALVGASSYYRYAASFVTSSGYVITCVYTGLNSSSDPTFKVSIHRTSDLHFFRSFDITHTAGSADITRIIGASHGSAGTGRFWFQGGGGLYYTSVIGPASTSATVTLATANITGVFDVHEGNGTQVMCYAGAASSGTTLYVGTLTSGGTHTTASFTTTTNSSCQFVGISPCSDLTGYVVGYHRTDGDIGWKELNSSLTATATFSGSSGISAYAGDGEALRICEMPGTSGNYLMMLDANADVVIILANDGGVVDTLFPPRRSRPFGGIFILSSSPVRRYGIFMAISDDNVSSLPLYYGIDLCVITFDSSTAFNSLKSICKIGVYNTQYQEANAPPIESNPWVGATYDKFCIATSTDTATEVHILEPFPDDIVATGWRDKPHTIGRRLCAVADGIATPLDVGVATDITRSISGAGTGTYTFRTVVAARDRSGIVARSAPSEAVTGTIGATSTTIGYSITNLNDSGYIELYATTNGGSILYYLGDQYGYSTSDTGSFVLPGSASSFWTDIAANRTLYTDGGELEASIIPHPYLIASSQDRLWLVPAEQRDEVWFSKIPSTGYSTEFNSALRLSIPQGGPITGIAALNDKMIVFKEDSAFAIYGQGPTNAGLGSSFSLENLNYGVGCTNANSVVSYPGGVLFLAKQGLYRIGQDLQPLFIGAAVEDTLRGVTITSATSFPARNEIRITTDSDLALVYNYLFDRWSTFDGIEANHSTLYGGDWVYLNRDSEGVNVAYESATSPVTAPAGTYDEPVMTWSTPWVKLSSVQDFKRVMRASFLMSQPTWPSGTHTSDVQVVVRYNYDNAGTTYAADTHTFLWSAISSIKPIQVQCHIEKQKVQSIKFEVTCTNPTGLGLALDAIELTVGMRSGVFKVPAAQKG